MGDAPPTKVYVIAAFLLGYIIAKFIDFSSFSKDFTYRMGNYDSIFGMYSANGAFIRDSFYTACNGSTTASIYGHTDSSSSAFDRIVDRAYYLALAKPPSYDNTTQRPKFSVNGWNRGNGGLSDEDRKMLAEIYRNADSVFEYGLGESTHIAAYVQVPRYAGIDSDAVWVSNARDQSPEHFRFYFADVGATLPWGYPKDKNLPKIPLNYQLSPLIVEPQPFDVYMVDGRWRFPCMMASFLHASSRGALPKDTTVLLHDCGPTLERTLEFDSYRVNYKAADHLLDLVQHSGFRLCVYKRKPETTDDQLLELWHKFMDDMHR